MQNKRQSWQKKVAETQRAQIINDERKRKTDQQQDLAYGQNLIKQLGYRNVQDKKPGNEPKGTLYDKLFESRTHRAKELAKKIEGTKLHIMTEKLQHERNVKQNHFSTTYETGGSLLEKKSNLKEDEAPEKRKQELASTANALH